MNFRVKKKQKKTLSYHISIRDFFLTFWKTILIWILIVVFIIIALHFKVDKLIIGGIVVIFGLITEAFVGMIGLIHLIPFIGPIIAKLLALPLFWMIHSVGYFLSIIAIKKGYSREVINYKILTAVFIAGIVVGFIIARML
jgi:hypothetical protein